MDYIDETILFSNRSFLWIIMESLPFHLRQTLQYLGCNIYRLLVKENVNLCVSPMSLMTLILTLLSGSRPSWLVTQMGPWTEEEIQEAFRQLITSLTNGPLKVTQALFADPHLKPIQAAYLHTVKHLGTDLILDCPLIDRPSACQDMIHQWVSNATQGKITHIIDRIYPTTLLILINAFYFKEDWCEPFSRVFLGDFYVTPNQIVKTSLMYNKGMVLYGTHPYGEAVQLNYKRSRFGFLVLLPINATEMDRLEQALSPDLIQAITSSMRLQEMELTLPRFSVTSELPMNRICQALNIPMTDWSHISPNLTSASFSIMQKAIIDVNQTGTEAAAVTVATLFGCVYTPPKLIVNRPFLFAIIEKQSNLMLFMGRYRVPNSS